MSESMVDLLSQGRDREAQASKIYGLVVGLVTNNKDPDQLGRVKVKFPWLDDTVESWWARLAYPMGGKQRGYWFIPEVDDEVLVGFEHGDVRHPYIVGSLYNGVDKPPSAAACAQGRDFNQDGKNDLRFIRSRSGHLLVFDDKDGSEIITLVDKTGNHKIEVDSKNKKIVLTNTDGDIEVHCPQGKFLVDCKQLDVHSSQDSQMKADTTFTIKSGTDYDCEAGASATFKSSTGMTVQAGTSLDASSGTSFSVSGGTTVDIEAQLSMKVNGLTAQYLGSTQVQIQGAIVQIN
jgi:uncharacterized protein involved in type VI secretion and phage assembly